ncbi:uncharacterized protein LOC132194022 [Neocloeon triangulifer]|uniref:uncharacterized protein LOC132194022 n=1 Tax=Neocloeon triangulifer TaxID=2078957 RepID=UPI00286F0863|nr:uncharacterized protein LOC132194022 [Neocloeon triangulifer]
MALWKRPESVPPKIWIREKGFVVRDITPDLDQFVLDFMVDNLCRDAPLSKSTELYKDQASLDDMVWIWRDLSLPQRVSLVALAEGTPGADMKNVGPENPPIILGANMLSVSSKGDPDLPILEMIKGHAIKKVFEHTEKFGKDVNVFEQFHVDHYMDALGLSVGRENRGRGLGELLLRARLELCRGLGIPLTKTSFTAAASQKLAARVGFEVVKEMSYSEMTDEDGKPEFPDLCDGVQTMQLCICRV